MALCLGFPAGEAQAKQQELEHKEAAEAAKVLARRGEPRSY